MGVREENGQEEFSDWISTGNNRKIEMTNIAIH